jgi:hypothetical protein
MACQRSFRGVERLKIITLEGMMKLIFVFTVLTSAAFAFTPVRGTYKGGGDWKDTNGKAGLWTRELVVTGEDGKAEITETLQVMTPQGLEIFKETVEWSAVMTKGGFFDILVAGKKTGWGYCLKRQCHLQGEGKDGGTYEETYQISKRALAVTGSEASSKETVIWQGKLKLATPKN